MKRYTQAEGEDNHMNSLSWRGFYAIVDLGALPLKDPLQITKALLAVKPVALQLRAKEASPREALSLAYAMSPLCQEAEVPLIINDRADIALLCQAWGVHLGQDDLPLLAAKKSFPGLRIGISTHSLLQVQQALTEGADYLGFGPVFHTSTKQNPDPIVGTTLLSQAIGLAKNTPVVAIGGIRRSHIPQLQEAGTRVVTSIGDVLHSETVEDTARIFQAAF
jgi:thiamine-phosphate pyrophosphorylase